MATTWEIFSMGHNTNYAHNMLLNDFDSDDDFEIIALLALEEERLERERASTSHRGLFQAVGSANVIISKATKDFFKTILQNHQYILLTYFEGGFE